MSTPSSVPGPDRSCASDAVRPAPGRRPNGGERFGAALSAELEQGGDQRGSAKATSGPHGRTAPADRSPDRVTGHRGDHADRTDRTDRNERAQRIERADRAKPARRRTSAEDETVVDRHAAGRTGGQADGAGVMANGAQAATATSASEPGPADAAGQNVTPAGRAAPAAGPVTQTSDGTAVSGEAALSIDRGVTSAESGKTPSEAHDRGNGAAGAAEIATGSTAAQGQPSDSTAGRGQLGDPTATQAQAADPTAAPSQPGGQAAPAGHAQSQAGQSSTSATAASGQSNGTEPAAEGTAHAAESNTDPAPPADAPNARDAAPGVPNGVLTGVAGPAPTAPATATAAPSAGPPAAPPAAQVAMQIVPLRLEADGVHRLTVHLHPVDLGPVQVVAEIRNGDVTLQLSGSTDAGTAALRDSLDDLRRELTASGFGNCSLDLRDGSDLRDGGDQPRQQYSPGRPSSGGTPAATPSPAATPEPARQSTGRLDVRA